VVNVGKVDMLRLDGRNVAEEDSSYVDEVVEVDYLMRRALSNMDVVVDHLEVLYHRSDVLVEASSETCVEGEDEDNEELHLSL